ncbi:MAG: mechanosensitive ion channel family protein, partial [Chloroflexi bacterium]|nr:mechanosensitive ion channel family protein [Chloroflexota bacterium]
VALALQPALSNLFSSAMMVGDGVVSDGDFIELQGGPMGNVIDVGWRSTKIMTPQGNIVSIPNSKLADTIFTNYQMPNPEMNAVITLGVSYDSDLIEVERIALEVCRQVRDEMPDETVVKTFEPLLLFREFGDSNITFIVILRASNRGNTFLVTHEVVKRLHERFGNEGIEINYPVRKLVYPDRDEGKPLTEVAAIRGGKAGAKASAAKPHSTSPSDKSGSL